MLFCVKFVAKGKLIMNKIREFRKKAGISQRELAKKIGVSFQSISFYEKGERQPKLETWIKLANFFNVSVLKLQGYEDKKVSTNEALNLIENKPNDKYTEAVIAEFSREFNNSQKEKINKLKGKLIQKIKTQNLSDVDLTLFLDILNSQQKISKNNQIADLKFRTFLKTLTGCILNKEFSKTEVTENLQSFLSTLE